MSLTSEILAQQPDNVLERLRRTDQFWSALKSGEIDAAEVVSNNSQSIGKTDTDIVICGGTLGISFRCSTTAAWLASYPN